MYALVVVIVAQLANNDRKLYFPSVKISLTFHIFLKGTTGQKLSESRHRVQTG